MLFKLGMAILTGSALALAGCGAPAKSASDVADLFTGDAKTLQDKETDLCATLAGRDEAPTTKGMNIDLAGCDKAGLAALDYKKISAFYFLGLDDQQAPAAAPAAGNAAASTDQVIHMSARSQVWLNKTLLGLASALGKKLGDKQGGNNKGLISLPDSSGGNSFSGLATSKVTITEDPKIDTATMAFGMKINLAVSGIVTTNNDIVVNGQLIGNTIAVTVKTTQDQPFEKSLLKNFQVVLVIIPHASDLYLDLWVDVNVYSIGFDGLVKDKIKSFLSTGLKGMIDSIMTL